MPRSGRPEPVRCLPASRREPAFPDRGPQIPTIPQTTKTAEILMLRPEKRVPLENFGTEGRTFSDDTRSTGDGATQGSDHRLASRQAREKQETAGRDPRSVVGRGWLRATRPSFRLRQASAHALGIAHRAAATLPADLIPLPRISSNRASVSLPVPVGIAVPRLSTPCHPHRPVTPPPAAVASTRFLIRPSSRFLF